MPSAFNGLIGARKKCEGEIYMRISEVSSSYFDNLIEDCHTAKTAEPYLAIDFELLFPLANEVVDFAELSDHQKGIYIIEDLNAENKDTFEALKMFKSNQRGTFACPKLNSPSHVLYVGSSTTGIKKRLEQHCGLTGAKQTSALHAKHWFTGRLKITVYLYEHPRNIIQLIEDGLSDALQPAFGKTGPNNK